MKQFAVRWIMSSDGSKKVPSINFVLLHEWRIHILTSNIHCFLAPVLVSTNS